MLWISLDRSSSIPLVKQVYEQLRSKILMYELQTGDKLPPTRTFAQEIGVSRNVVINAYEQLVAEGYLESREGSGTYVAEGVYLEDFNDYRDYLCDYDNDERGIIQNDEVIDFATGTPDLSCFPRNIWAKLLRDACLDAADEYFDYCPSEGIWALRVTLTKFLLRSKGIRCHPKQMMILPGSAQGFAIIARLLATPSHPIILEDPSYRGIQRILQRLDFSLCPVPADDKGIQVDSLPIDSPASFIIVTPSHHFPLGSVLPIQRRVKLIEYARQMNTYIVENDYDSEFRYVGSPISSIHVLDPELVIHIGTFSETLYPALRLGYMIVPEHLIEACQRLMASSGLGSSSMKQLALATFINEGYLERHISKMKKLYYKKREILISSLTKTFGSEICIHGDSTGLYVLGEFQRLSFSAQCLNTLRQHGVRIYPVEDHAIIKGHHTGKVIFGYGNVKLEDIERGVQRIRNALKLI